MISNETEQVLERWYPGCRFDDGYYFVTLGHWKYFVYTSKAGVTAAQMYEDLFRAEERLLLTCVFLDPAPYLPPGTHIEERLIAYTPDWNVCDTLPQRFAAIRGQDLDAAGFFGAVIGSFHAPYIVSPRTGFALTYDGCYAASEEGAAELRRRYPVPE